MIGLCNALAATRRKRRKSKGHLNFRRMSLGLKWIVTAGPTFEKLDEVRRLTNFSTGALGTELANFLSVQGHEVELLRGQGATCRVEPVASRVQEFTTTADLQRRLQALGSGGAVAVFHVAAVSDFTFGQVWERAADGSLKPIQAAKISTERGNLLAELVPTPKIIAELRTWFPKAFLVGWKYELEADRAQAVERARRQVSHYKTDACVVNGRAYGEGFGLMTQSGPCRHLAGRHLLFDALEKVVSGAQTLGHHA
jgi:phosphopantothenoylcysteine decarboxylase/phosphopantothenate--cysteine ligase